MKTNWASVGPLPYRLSKGDPYKISAQKVGFTTATYQEPRETDQSSKNAFDLTLSTVFLLRQIETKLFLDKNLSKSHFRDDFWLKWTTNCRSLPASLVLVSMLISKYEAIQGLRIILPTPLAGSFRLVQVRLHFTSFPSPWHTVMLFYLNLTFHGEIDTLYVSRRVSESAKKITLLIICIFLYGELTWFKILGC